MKRQAICIALMMMTVGCGGSTDPTGGQATTTPSGGTVPPAPAPDDEEPHRYNIIVLTVNAAGKCTATVSVDKHAVQRRHKIRWSIENHTGKQCDENDLELRFDKGAMAEDDDPNSDVLNPVPAKNRKIEARVHASADKVPDDEYPYMVYYKGTPASPDPQLDISGDCGCILPKTK